MIAGKGEGGVGAPRMADQEEFLRDADGLDKTHKVLADGLKIIAAVGVAGRTMAPLVKRPHLPMLRQVWRYQVQNVQGRGKAVDQDEWWEPAALACTPLHIVKIY